MNDKKLALLMELYKEYWDTEEIDVDLANRLIKRIPSLVEEIRNLKEQLRFKETEEKAIKAHIKEQSKKVKHLFPLENTAGYGQLCDKVLSFERALKDIASIAIYSLDKSRYFLASQDMQNMAETILEDTNN